jgi:heat shock protein HslJ
MRAVIYLFMMAALLLGAVAACTPAGGEPEGTGAGDVTLEELEGTTWILESFGPADNPTEPLPNAVPTLHFENMGSINGFSGCNQFFGEIAIDGRNITISGVGGTEMACLDPGVMEQESAYYSALTSATTITRDGDTLVIGYEGGELRYTMEQPTPDPLLTGTEWQLNSFITGETAEGAASSLIAGTTITLLFNEEGSMGGHGGCNSYGSQYQVDGETITISDLVSTLMACEAEGVTEQETTYLSALGTVETFAIEGNQLTIKYPGGALVFSATQ